MIKYLTDFSQFLVKEKGLGNHVLWGNVESIKQRKGVFLFKWEKFIIFAKMIAFVCKSKITRFLNKVVINNEHLFLIRAKITDKRLNPINCEHTKKSIKFLFVVPINSSQIYWSFIQDHGMKFFHELLLILILYNRVRE
jgi:hypothetical protein